MKTIRISCDVKDYLELDELTPLQGALKSLSKKDYAKLKKEVLESGFAFPIMVWKEPKGKTYIVGGHQRVRFLQELRDHEGYRLPLIPIVKVAASSILEAKRRVIQDVSQYGKVDRQGLYEFLAGAEIAPQDLIDSFTIPDVSMDLNSFRQEFYDSEVADGGENEAVVQSKDPVTKLGDIYQLGGHRLMCGDSTDPDSVHRLMNGEKALLMVTDPPYGVKLDQSWRDGALGEKALGNGNKNKIANDDRADWYEAWSIAPVQIAYVWHASSFTDVVMQSLRRADFDVRQQIIWNKSVMVMGRSSYHFKHEPCWYCVKKGSDAHWVGDRKQTTIWDAAPPNHIMGGSKEENTDHPTQKPVKLYEIPIQNHTGANDSLYEPFGGSGSAIIACEKMSRRCFMMELDPGYCDGIISRWERYTGLQAKLLTPRVKKLRKKIT